MSKGLYAGYPITDCKVTLYDGSFHEVDSSDNAFKIAGSMAFQDAAKKAGVTLIEPIMKVQVIIPDEFLGDVTGSINAKRGQIKSMEGRERVKVVEALIPLAELFGYSTELRSATQGRGTFNMEFSYYAIIPDNIAKELAGE